MEAYWPWIISWSAPCSAQFSCFLFSLNVGRILSQVSTLPSSSPERSPWEECFGHCVVTKMVVPGPGSEQKSCSTPCISAQEQLFNSCDFTTGKGKPLFLCWWLWKLAQGASRTQGTQGCVQRNCFPCKSTGLFLLWTLVEIRLTGFLLLESHSCFLKPPTF